MQPALLRRTRSVRTFRGLSGCVRTTLGPTNPTGRPTSHLTTDPTVSVIRKEFQELDIDVTTPPPDPKKKKKKKEEEEGFEDEVTNYTTAPSIDHSAFPSASLVPRK